VVCSAGCGVIVPDDCARNTVRVVKLSFDGPAVIPTTPEFDLVGYDVTMTIVKEADGEVASACFLVRDDDPWYKLFWAVDDVLDGNIITFSASQTTRTIRGHFSLFAEKDEEVCGVGSLPGTARIQGCSDERTAEIYLQPLGVKGAESERQSVTVQ